MNGRYFLMGAAFGAVAGMLCALPSRKKLREPRGRTYFDMKDDIIEEMKEIEEITRETYEKVVDAVVMGYEESKIITSWEASRIKEELKSGYERLKKILTSSSGVES
jgi:gas vesicle protein